MTPVRTTWSPVRRLSAQDLCLVFLVYTFAFLIVAGFPHARAGFPLDDSWIHQVVARNFAHDGSLGFVPGRRSSGSSSLLWTILLAAKWKFLPHVDPVLYSALLNGFLLIATGCGLLVMTSADRLPETVCWTWALAPALNGNFVWFGLIGMEAVLFVALSIVAVYLWFQESLRSAVLCTLCIGALSLTRPEGFVLAVLAVFAARWAGRRRRDVLVLAVVVTACMSASLIANFFTSHSWLPATYSGKKILLYNESGKIPLFRHFRFIYELARNPIRPWPIPDKHSLHLLDMLAAILIAIVVVMGVGVLIRGRSKRMLFLLLWCAVHIVMYAIMLPIPGHAGRYQPLFVALSLPLIFLGVYALIRFAAGWGGLHVPKLLPAVVLFTACAVAGFFSLWSWRQITDAGIAHIEGTHGEMGKFLVRNLQPQTRVGAFDIGRMGYLYGSNLIDLGGVTDSSFLPFMREQRVLEYLAEQQIHYVVWPSIESGASAIPGLLDLPAVSTPQITVLDRVCSPHDVWRKGSVTGHATPCQTLYLLH
jgi:hypothetical protein